MYNFCKKGAMLLLAVSLTANLVSCDEEVEFENAPSVTPPAVEVAPNTLSGIITNKAGQPIRYAIVHLNNLQTATNENGVYKFSNVKAGSYTLKATAKGMIAVEDQLVVTETGKTQNLQWSAVLAQDLKTEVVVKAEQAAHSELKAEAIEGNTKAEVVAEVDVPAAAIANVAADKEVKVFVTPIYDAEMAKRARAAAQSELMVGSTVSCNQAGAYLAKSIELTYVLDAEMAKAVEARKLVNGQWVAAKSAVKNGTVVVEADMFTSYGLFLDVAFNETASSQAIAFDQPQGVWDNLYGSQAITVGEATYSYKMGTEVEVKGTTVLTALLIEKLAARYGYSATTQKGAHTLNVTLPVGTKLTVSGTQELKKVTVSAKDKSVSGTTFGKVSIVAATYNRDHVGGSN